MPRPVPSTQPIPIVAYARVSQMREEMISPEIQLESIRHWAAMRNRTIVEEIVDPNSTGRNFDRKIQRAIELVEEGVATEIAVYKFSRFGRTRRGWELNYGRLEDVGGDLVSSTEEVDARTATGKLTRGMLMQIAAFESDRFSDQWKDTAAYREKLGLPHTATPRFGYIHHKCTFQELTKGGWRIVHEKDPECRTDGPCKEEFRVDPVTGPVLATMYSKYNGGMSLVKIAAWLIERGTPTTRGGIWRATTVADLLDSGFGAGLIQVGVHRTGSRKVGMRARDWKPGAHDAIVDAQTWSIYKARRLRMRGSVSDVRQKWPLSGITLCGHCQGPMTCTTGRGGPGYIMRCVKSQDNEQCPGIWIVTVKVEAALFEALDGFAGELEAAGRRVARTIREQRTDVGVNRKALERELAKVESGRINLVNAVVAGALPLEKVAEKHAELDADEARIRGLLAQTEVPRKAWTPPQVRSIRTDWDRLPLDTRREMVRELVDKIVVQPDKTIDVTLSKALVG